MKKISLPTSFFDDNKIKAMSLMKNCDTALLLYFKFLFGVAKSDGDGKLMLYADVAYDEKIISGIYNIPEKIVSECLELLIKFGMISKSGDCYIISNYSEIIGKDSKENHNASQRRYADKKKNEISADIQKSTGMINSAEG